MDAERRGKSRYGICSGMMRCSFSVFLGAIFIEVKWGIAIQREQDEAEKQWKAILKIGAACLGMVILIWGITWLLR